MQRVVSLFLATWPTDRLRRKSHGAPPGRPLVTAASEGGRRVIVGADAAARALGLRPGLTLAHARATVPDLAVADADPLGEAADLVALAGWCVRRYSPLAAASPPDGIWIDATGCAHLFGGEGPMLADLVGRLDAGGIEARAAIADTPGAAHALARYGGSAPVVIAPPGATAKLLARLPVVALRLPAATLEGLHALGIERIGQLYDMPSAPLALRFGPEPGRRLDQALGLLAEPIDPIRPAQPLQARLGFAEPIGTPAALERVIQQLVATLCRDLEQRGLGARRLDLLFHRVDDVGQSIRVGTARPSREPRHLARLLAERLETVDPGFGIEAMVLLAALAEPFTPGQIDSGLGGGEPTADVASLVDILANRLGADRLYRAAPVESEIPERSVRRVPPLAAKASAGKASAGWPVAWPRPTRLLDPPEPVEALALLPDHPPARFTWRGQRHRVQRADGPERVFGEWWSSADETAMVRDYFHVEDEAGGRFWLFRSGDGTDPATGSMGWFMHGIFG